MVPTPWQEWTGTHLALNRGLQSWARSQAFTVMQMLFGDENNARHPVEVMYNVEKKRTTVTASKDLQVGELKITPWATDLSTLSTDAKHLLDPDCAIIKVTLQPKAEEMACQGKPQEKPNVTAPASRRPTVRSSGASKSTSGNVWRSGL